MGIDSRQENDPIHVLTGCTAVGKTALALEWAEANDAEIVSCDSLLFYRGMDIGTAKPSPAERARVPHHLIDVREASVQMDVGEYLDLAIETLQSIRERGKRVLVTGGSGFYLKAFFEPVVDSVSVSPETRERVAQLEAEEGLAGMLGLLEKLDPACRSELDCSNPRRVIRALERCLETGESIRVLKEAFAAQRNALTDAPKRLVVLQRDGEDLNERIDQRVEQMLRAGLIEEVERLRAEGFEANPSGAGAIGYREALAYLRGDYDRESLKEAIAANTRRLAKKQRTWFRTQLPEGKRIDLSGAGRVSANELFDGMYS